MLSDFEQLQRNYYQRYAFTPAWGHPVGHRSSDIVLHLPVLEWFASRCSHCTEFGVREGHSTVALLAGCRGQVVSYDIERTPVVNVLHAMELPCPWEFRLADTSDPTLFIDETDLLFIDTLHTYDHVKKELALHARRSRKFLAFHDTFTCGHRDESGPNPSARGILPAIEEFLTRFPGEYKTVYRTECCNGLLVLERITL